MAIDEELRQKREAVCWEHMTAETAHDFPRCAAAFAHPRYELLATGEVFEGTEAVIGLLEETRTAFPDFHYDVDKLNSADEAIFVEGVFRGTHLGNWRGLPATGRKVEVPMLVVFRFEGENMVGEQDFFDLNTFFLQMGVAWDPASLRGKLTIALSHPLTIARGFLGELLSRRH